MKLSYLFFSILFFYSGCLIHAQVQETFLHDIMDYIKNEDLSYKVLEEPYSEIDGNPYLFREFDEGNLVMNSGDVVSGVFRMDLYADAIQFMYEGEVYVLNFTEKISLLRIGETLIKNITYREEGRDKNGYLICLLDEDPSLFLRKIKVLRSKQIARGFQQPRPAMFLDRKDMYYVKTGKDPAVEIGNRKEMMSLFPGRESEIDEILSGINSETALNPDSYRHIEGTPYLYDYFMEGKVLMKSGESYPGVFRLNIYANTVEQKKEGKITRLRSPEKISMVNMGGIILKYIDYTDEGRNRMGYFICLSDKHHSLYVKKEKILRGKQIAKAYQQPSPSRFLDKKDVYYLKRGEDPAVEVRSKKALLDLYPDHIPVIKEYMHKERLNFRNQYDMVQLLEFINEQVI